MAALPIFGKKEKPVQPPPSPSDGAESEEPRKLQLGRGLHIVRPHITEKATELGSSKNQYVFVVQPRSSKKEIARDVEHKYGVSVEKVRVVNVHAKKMRLGRTKGMKKGYKKAIVQVKEGQKIEILPT